MSQESRLRKIESVIAPKANKEFLLIFQKPGQSLAEAISKHEQENQIKFDEDRHDLMIVQLVETREDIEWFNNEVQTVKS